MSERGSDMMIEMTDAEVRAYEERLRRFKESPELVDRVAAVLMDMHVASSGAPEGKARE